MDTKDVKARAASLSVNAILAVAGGFLDGFTYVGHGRVFANGMTANMLLFSASIFTRSWQAAVRFLPPILAFMAAIWVAQAIQLYSTRRHAATPYRAVLLLEIGVLIILSLLPASTTDLLFTTSIAFTAAMQMQTFREVDGRAYTSTFTTGNLRTLGEAAFTWLFLSRSPETACIVRNFAVIVTAFLAGGLAGAGTTKAFGNHALWCAILLLVLVEVQIQTRGFGRKIKRRSPVSATSSLQVRPNMAEDTPIMCTTGVV